MDDKAIKRFLDDVRRMSRDVKWERREITPDSHGYVGTGDKIQVVVASFGLEDQGFPAGSRGYDGTARVGNVVVRLPRDVAEELYKQAEKGERR